MDDLSAARDEQRAGSDAAIPSGVAGAANTLSLRAPLNGPSRFLRLVTSTCLALYLTLVVGLPVLHALDGKVARSITSETHFHDADSGCVEGHDELHCPANQGANQVALAADGAAAPAVSPGNQALAGHSLPARASASAYDPSLPRGPPRSGSSSRVRVRARRADTL